MHLCGIVCLACRQQPKSLLSWVCNSTQPSKQQTFALSTKYHCTCEQKRPCLASCCLQAARALASKPDCSKLDLPDELQSSSPVHRKSLLCVFS